MGRAPAPQITRPLRSVMLERLIAVGQWVDSATLSRGASTSQVAIEDVMADLVIEGLAEYRQEMGYRLAGTPVARRAAKRLLWSKSDRAVQGEQVGSEYRVGVAERRLSTGGELGLVMYELALPLPVPGPKGVKEHMKQINALIAFAQGEVHE